MLASHLLRIAASRSPLSCNVEQACDEQAHDGIKTISS